MNEVKPVSSFIASVVAFAVALGAAGTLYDAIRSTQKDVARAVTKERLSYSRWNSTLQRPPKQKN